MWICLDFDFFIQFPKFRPNELDCLVFGHIFTICNYPFLDGTNLFSEILEKFPNLLIHNKRIFKDYFQDDFVASLKSKENFRKLKNLTDLLGGKKTIFYWNFSGAKIVNTTALSVIKCVLKEDLDFIRRKTKVFKELKSLG